MVVFFLCKVSQTAFLRPICSTKVKEIFAANDSWEYSVNEIDV